MGISRSVGIDFFESRFSCRQFSAEPVTPTEIELAVVVAQKAPAVCNRQSGRVRAFTRPEDIQRVLDLQGGARGFAEGVRALFCISVDLRNFHGVGERYQGWIDGGLFAMSFLLGLHRQGIGSCCLNWSKDVAQDQAMRNLLNLPPHELIIMFVAAGHLPENFVVARSVRKPTTEVLSFESLR
jgi:nitroreductase